MHPLYRAHFAERDRELRRLRKIGQVIVQAANENRRGGGKHLTRSEEMYIWTTLSLLMFGFFMLLMWIVNG
jgi:hypothetical protein